MVLNPNHAGEMQTMEHNVAMAQSMGFESDEASPASRHSLQSYSTTWNFIQSPAGPAALPSGSSVLRSFRVATVIDSPSELGP